MARLTLGELVEVLEEMLPELQQEEDDARARGRADGLAIGRSGILDGGRAGGEQHARDRPGDRVAACTEARREGVARLESLLESHPWMASCDPESDLLRQLFHC